MTPKASRETRPPAWAESARRALLEPRNRDTISGDLLEEYCEAVLPARGELRAKGWCIRQVASFVTAVRLIHATIAWVREDIMFERRTRASWLFFGNVPTMLVPVLVMFSTVLGTNWSPARQSNRLGHGGLAPRLSSVPPPGPFRGVWTHFRQRPYMHT